MSQRERKGKEAEIRRMNSTKDVCCCARRVTKQYQTPFHGHLAKLYAKNILKSVEVPKQHFFKMT